MVLLPFIFLSSWYPYLFMIHWSLKKIPLSGGAYPQQELRVPSRTDENQNLIHYTLFAWIIVFYHSLQYVCCVFDRPRTEAFLIKQHLVYAVGLTQIVLLVSIGAYEKEVSFPAEFSLVQFLITLRRKLSWVWPQGSTCTGNSHPGLL